MTETVVDEEAWLLASPQKPRRRGARAVVACVLAVSVLALAAVRGALPSAPRPAGRLYYEDGQTFADLQTSLAEFEKEWHNAFPEELVAQWEEAAETYAAAWDKLLPAACPDGDASHACVPLGHDTWHANWDKAFFPGNIFTPAYPQTDVFEPNPGLWLDEYVWGTPDELSTFEEMWSPGLQQWDAHFAPDVEPAIESTLGGLLGNLLTGPIFGGVPVVDRNGLDSGAAASGGSITLDSVKITRHNEDGTETVIYDGPPSGDEDPYYYGPITVTVENKTPVDENGEPTEEGQKAIEERLAAAEEAAGDGEGNSGGGDPVIDWDAPSDAPSKDEPEIDWDTPVEPPDAGGGDEEEPKCVTDCDGDGLPDMHWDTWIEEAKANEGREDPNAPVIDWGDGTTSGDGDGEEGGGDGKPDLVDVDGGDSGEFDLIPMGDSEGDGDGEFDLLPIDTGDGDGEDEPDLLPVKSGDGDGKDGDGEDTGSGTHVPLLCDEDCEGDEPDLLPVESGGGDGDGDGDGEETGGGTVVPLLKDDDGGDEPNVPLLKDDDGGSDDGGDEPDEPDAGDASTTPDDNGGANGGDGVLPEDNDDGASQPGAGGATSGGVAPTVKGPGYGQTMPGHDATGGFRPVLNAGPDLSEVTQPGLGQGNTFVTSWDDMRKK